MLKATFCLCVWLLTSYGLGTGHFFGKPPSPSDIVSKMVRKYSLMGYRTVCTAKWNRPKNKILLRRPFTNHLLLSYSDGSEARLRVELELRRSHRLRQISRRITHVVQFCQQTGKGIGGLSKQTFERCHSKFPEFSRYKLRQNVGDSEYCIKEFNALHLS